MSQPYIQRVIEWFEAHSDGGVQLKGSQCADIARRLRAEMGPGDPTDFCVKPKQHAPNCGCGNLGGTQ